MLFPLLTYGHFEKNSHVWMYAGIIMMILQIEDSTMIGTYICP